MEKARPWCGQPSNRGRLKNRTEHYVVLHPQNGDRIVTMDSVTSLHSAYTNTMTSRWVTKTTLHIVARRFRIAHLPLSRQVVSDRTPVFDPGIAHCPCCSVLARHLHDFTPRRCRFLCLWLDSAAHEWSAFQDLPLSTPHRAVPRRAAVSVINYATMPRNLSRVRYRQTRRSRPRNRYLR